MDDPVAIRQLLPSLADSLAVVPDGEWRRREAAAAEQAALDREAARAAEAAVRLDSVPAKFAAAELEHPAAVALVERLPDGPGLLLCGPTGTGKSHVVWSVYRALAIAGGPRMEVVKVVRLLARLRPGGRDDQEALERLIDVPVLALDDLGAHQPSPWALERIYELVDSRYEAERPVVATSNLRGADLARAVGDACASRLHECCEYAELTGRDRRRP